MAFVEVVTMRHGNAQRTYAHKDILFYFLFIYFI